MHVWDLLIEAEEKNKILNEAIGNRNLSWKEFNKILQEWIEFIRQEIKVIKK